MKATSPTVIAAPAGEPPARRIGAPRAAYAIGLLLAIYVLNFLDRQVLSILAEPIKRDLALADWQLGAMTGLAFAALYTAAGLPIARLAERGDRPLIIATATAVWSGFTMVCGITQSFVQLLLARLGVGFGEAGCTPPALSLISEYVAPARRSSAVAIYMSGAHLGALLGMAIGGLVADRWGWRAAFFCVGSPGLVIAAAAALTLPEPRRAEAGAQRTVAETPSVRETLAVLRSKPTYRLIVAGVTIKAFLQYGLQTFLGSFFFRNHAVELASAAKAMGLGPAGFLGLTLGLALGVSGVVGSLLGGWLADRYGARDPRARTLVPAAAILLGIPIYVWALTTPSMGLALVLLMLPTALNAMHNRPAYGVVQGLVPPAMRATATAVMLFVVNLIGLGLGPIGVGLVSDLIGASFGSAAGVRWSLAIFVLLGAPAAAVFWRAGRSVEGDTVS